MKLSDFLAFIIFFFFQVYSGAVKNRILYINIWQNIDHPLAVGIVVVVAAAVVAEAVATLVVAALIIAGVSSLVIPEQPLGVGGNGIGPNVTSVLMEC